MTQRIALVAANGRVRNVIVAEMGYQAPDGLAAIPDDTGAAEPGGRWAGAVFLPPEQPSPPPRTIAKTTIYRRATDAELALLEATLAALPLRQRLLWQDAESGTVYVHEVEPVFVAAVGAPRAAELLAP